ncbi:MAG TPA: cupredoxin domain-containing protein [Vicinamibacteria bacterium]|nr:cupredoxin domain-containing protein [Vicinamibacteria bacterium]
MLAAMLLVLVGALWLAALSWFPPVASAHGSAVQRMLDFTLSATGAFFVAGHLVLAAILIRALRQAPAAGSKREAWWVGVVPALLMAVAAEGGVLALGLPVWKQYYGPPPQDALTVEVTGRQFFWVMRYPGPDGVFGPTRAARISTDDPLGLDRGVESGRDDVVLLNELRLPRGKPVRLVLHSTDVIHSFWVPELRVKQNLVPGMRIEIWFTPTAAGEFEIACNQICGLGHYRMKGALQVVEEADFERWLSEQPEETS